MAFKDRPTSSVWYIGEAGSQNDGDAAPTYSGPFVMGNRTAASAYSERMRIDMSGNVGIGTTTPTTTLQVMGTISGTSGLFEAGSVGIGTSSPTTSLQVIGGMSGVSGIFGEGLLVSGEAVATGITVSVSNLALGWSIDQDLETTDSVTFDTVSGTTSISGARGIFGEGLLVSGQTVATGTTVSVSNLSLGWSIDQDLETTDSPTLAALTIDDYITHNGDADTYLGFPSADTVNIIAGGHSALKLDNSVGNPVIQLNNTNADIDVQIMADDGNVILHTDAATNVVGIGTAQPIYNMDISGATSSWIGLRQTDGSFSIGNSDINGDSTKNYSIYDVDNGGHRLVVSDAGNVGIGTTSPTSELQVIGTISGATVTGESVFATHIQEQLVDGATPSSDDVLKWNGTKWISDTVSNAGAATQSNLDNTYVMDQSTRKTDDVRFNTISGNSGYFTGAFAVGAYVPSGTVGSIVASNDVISSYTSDERLKDNITPIPDSLTKISQIAGVEFDWNEKAYSHLAGHDVGVIAQQLEEVLPEAVSTRDDGYKAVKYEKIIPLLIEGLKEQEKRITLLEEKLKDD